MPCIISYVLFERPLSSKHAQPNFTTWLSIVQVDKEYMDPFPHKIVVDGNGKGFGFKLKLLYLNLSKIWILFTNCHNKGKIPEFAKEKRLHYLNKSKFP